jgi:hypothetical protein
MAKSGTSTSYITQGAFYPLKYCSNFNQFSHLNLGAWQRRDGSWYLLLLGAGESERIKIEPLNN